jgi:hypothetical protein
MKVAGQRPSYPPFSRQGGFAPARQNPTQFSIACRKVIGSIESSRCLFGSMHSVGENVAKRMFMIAGCVGLLGTALSLQASTIAFAASSTTANGNAPGPFSPIGQGFTVSGGGIQIDDLGVFDYQANGLGGAHEVAIWKNPGTGTGLNAPAELISIVVPAGTAGTLDGTAVNGTTTSGFRFSAGLTGATVDSGSIVGGQYFLAAGSYAVVAYNLGSGGSTADPYGDGSAPPSGSNVAFSGNDFYTAGSGSDIAPTAGDTNQHASASFRYDAVPEPTSLGMIGMLSVGLLRRARRGRR